MAAAYSHLRALEVSDADTHAEANAERLYYIAECARKLNDEDQMMEAVKKLGKHRESPWRCKALLAVDAALFDGAEGDAEGVGAAAAVGAAGNGTITFGAGTGDHCRRGHSGVCYV